MPAREESRLVSRWALEGELAASLDNPAADATAGCADTVAPGFDVGAILIGGLLRRDDLNRRNGLGLSDRLQIWRRRVCQRDFYPAAATGDSPKQG